MISKTDRLILGIILHLVRDECGKEINFKANGTRREVFESLPTQIAVYFCNQFFTGVTSRKDLSTVFNCDRSYIVYCERAIQTRLNNNRTFQYMMRRISAKIKKELRRKIASLTDQ